MKTLRSVTIILFLALISQSSYAQSTTEEIKIRTSAVCNMCKTTLEQNLALEKGIKRTSLDVSSKVLTVSYNPKKTTPEAIRKAITKLGYDADDQPADAKSYEKLDGCCKKGNTCEEPK
jgi:copper chaperone CopZ